jgi:hypothetical protein
MTIRKNHQRKEIEYTLLTAFELAKEIDRVGYETEIRFVTEDMMRKNFWEQPQQMHSVRRTLWYCGDNLIVGKMDGGGTMIRNPADYTKAGYADSQLAQIDGLCEIISDYLLQYGNGAQRVAVMKTKVA